MRNVFKARSSQSAKKIAFSIANSPLVKTAIAGEDPNWGRIIMALGKAKVKIPAGTQSGKILRLRGKGIKDINSSVTGDQLIHVNLWTPKKLTSEEEKFNILALLDKAV